MSWFRKPRRLHSSPITIAKSLHRIMAAQDDPQTVPEAFHLPHAVHARFREKVSLYREANILLVLVNRVKPLHDVAHGDPLFKPVLQEYERIVFPQSHEVSTAARAQSMLTAFQDLSHRIHLESESSNGIIDDSRKSPWWYDWSRNWFASIGHDETNLATLLLLFVLWANFYTIAQRGLDFAVLQPSPGLNDLIGCAIKQAYESLAVKMSLERKSEPINQSVNVQSLDRLESHNDNDAVNTPRVQHPFATLPSSA